MHFNSFINRYPLNRPLISFLFCALSGFLFPANGYAQLNTQGLEHLFTPPQLYTAPYTDQPLKVDGRLSESAWNKAAWSEVFNDIEGSLKPAPTYPTRMKMIWNDSCLYIAAELTEPDVWASLRNHDDIVFHDNDFEVFIDPDNNTQTYYEIEVNAINTIFDLLLTKPYRNGGQAIIDWDLKGLQSAVTIQGTLNDPKSADKGWTVEMAIPFRSVSTGGRLRPNREEQLWRINFSRVEWDAAVVDGRYTRVKDSTGRFKPEHNWVWSPQGVINMHFPERWGYLRFTKNPAGPFVLPAVENLKKMLWICYYRQKAYFSKNNRYAQSLSQLGIDAPEIDIDGAKYTLSLESTSRQFTAAIAGADQSIWSIDQDGYIQPARNR